MIPGVIMFHWSGEGMFPMRRYADQCDDVFKVGDVYHMEVTEPRRESSHRHYFAALDEAWASLPHEFDMETWAQSREHMRH